VIGTGIDLTDRGRGNSPGRLQAELARQVQGVQALTRELEVIKGELASVTETVSHGLRSPLRWISGLCEALESTAASRLDFKGRRYLRRLRRMIRQTGERTEALLHHSRLARAEVRRQEIDLSGQAHAIAAALQRTAPGAGWNSSSGPASAPKAIPPCSVRSGEPAGQCLEIYRAGPPGQDRVRGPARHGRDPGVSWSGTTGPAWPQTAATAG